MGQQWGPPVSCAFRRDGRRKLGGMDRGRAGPGGPGDSHHPPLCNAARLQLRSALPRLTGWSSASQFCLLPANPSLQKVADPETGSCRSAHQLILQQSTAERKMYSSDTGSSLY